jgi:hypothetical protein
MQSTADCRQPKAQHESNQATIRSIAPAHYTAVYLFKQDTEHERRSGS